MANILICTGIYPPHIGGPAQYAKEIKEEFERQGHVVRVLTYKLERRLLPLIRHELFFWKTIFAALSLRSNSSDFIIALDTFSVGWPAVVAAQLLRKNIIIRTGGDFLWESYVERTGEKVLLKDFYTHSAHHAERNLTFKERFIFQVTRWTLQNASAVVFSTEWQRDIFTPAYKLDPTKNFIIENFYGENLATSRVGEKAATSKRVFVAGTRPLKWKNIDTLKRAFDAAKAKVPDIELDLTPAPYEKFVEKIKHSYAVILTSLGDISPNMILDALRVGTPFILTRENGLMPRLKDVGMFVDPLDEQDIAEKIVALADPHVYAEQKKKVADVSFRHSWADITHEFLEVAGRV